MTEDRCGENSRCGYIEHSDKKHSGWGEVFIQHHRDYDKLLPDMLEYAETYLIDSKKKQVFIPIYDYDEALIVSVQERGYQKNNSNYSAS